MRPARPEPPSWAIPPSRRRLSRLTRTALGVAAGFLGLSVLVAVSGEDQVADDVPARTAAAGGALLRQAANGDGDSWKDTTGVEYRMGLINTPELNECGGSRATSYRRSVLSSGFRAESYQIDRYGRAVSVIFTSEGVNLNVDMARQGLADDRYLAQYRSENTSLARDLDGAFAEAKAAKRGVWGSCGTASGLGPAGSG